MENSQNPQNTHDAHHIDVSNPSPSPSAKSSESNCNLPVFLRSAVYFYIALPFVCLASIVVSPLLLIFVLITRLLQFTKDENDENYINATKLKHFIRGTLCINMLIILLTTGLVFYPIIELVPTLKHAHFLDLPIPNWIGIICMSCAFYIFSFLVYQTLHSLLGRTVNPVGEAVYEIIDCFIFLWAVCEVGKRVPCFKHHQLVGFLTRNFIVVSLLLLVGYNTITLLTQVLVYIVQLLVNQQKQNSKHWSSLRVITTAYQVLTKLCTLGGGLTSKNLVYYATGTKRSIDFVLSTLMILVTWVYYFGSHLHEPTSSKVARSVWTFGLWSLVSVVICAFLWLIKTCLLLRWMDCRVYHRFESQILETGKQLKLLTVLKGCVGSHKEDKKFQGILRDRLHHVKIDMAVHDEHEPKKEVHESMDAIKRVAQEILKAKSELCKETYIKYMIEDDYVWEILSTGNGEVDKRGTDDKKKDKSCLVDCICKSLDQFLKSIICFKQSEKKEVDHKNTVHPHQTDDVDDPQTMSLDFVADVQNWVVMTHKSCVFVANNLSSAEEMGCSLNKIMSVVVLSATFILWLLHTGLATTQLLVLVTSPLLAATFIFGDTCKALFQGFIFAFVLHPIDIGDLCVIDGNMLEVKSFSIWRTTFSKVGKEEEETHPNSELFNKRIINHKTDIDWNDRVEFRLVYLGQNEFNNLRNDIIQLLDESKNPKLAAGYTCMEVLTKGEDITIAIDFRHEVVATIKNNTYLERLQQKQKQRSELAVKVWEFLDNRKLTPKTSDNNEKRAQEGITSISETGIHSNLMNHEKKTNTSSEITKEEWKQS